MALKASTGAPEQQDTLVSEIFVCFEDFEGSGAWLRPAVIQMGFKITDLLKSSHHPTEIPVIFLAAYKFRPWP